VVQIKILSLLHDTKKERYAVYYSGILLVITIAITLLVTGIFEIRPIEEVYFQRLEEDDPEDSKKLKSKKSS